MCDPTIDDVFEPSMDTHIETVNEWTLIIHTIDNDSDITYLFFTTPTKREIFYNAYFTKAVDPSSNAIHIWEHYDNREYKYNLGLYYLTSGKHDTARKYLLVAAKANHVEAMYKLAESYEDNDMKSSALYWYDMAAKRGHSDAIVYIAYCIDFGIDGWKEDKKKAFDMYMMAAEKGSSLAAYNIAQSYKFGQGVEKSTEAFLYWSFFAIQSGCAYSPYSVAYHKFRKKHYESAIQYCDMGITRIKNMNTKTSQTRDIVNARLLRARSHMRLGHHYTTFIDDLKYCHSNGSLLASYELGELYRHDDYGMTSDFKEAIGYTMYAADHEYHDAIWTLGYMYENGQGVTQDYEIAVDYYNACLNEDETDIDALHSLAQCYENGYGVDKDIVHAHYLYKEAASYGCEYSEEWLDEYEKTMESKYVIMRYDEDTSNLRIFQKVHAYPYFRKYNMLYDIDAVSVIGKYLYIEGDDFEFENEVTARNAFQKIVSYLPQNDTDIVYDTDNVFFLFSNNVTAIDTDCTDWDDETRRVVISHAFQDDQYTTVMFPNENEMRDFLKFLQEKLVYFQHTQYGR